ncbi:MAG: S41 family peptidase [Cyclobacteriaceae bacterium]
MKRTISMALLLALFSACEEIFLREDEPDTPTNNFEIFWNDLDQHYSLFEVRNIDWYNLYKIYRPQVNDEISSDELWTIMTEMMENLDDSHTTLFDGNFSYKAGYAVNEQSIAEFDGDLIIDQYLEFHHFVSSEDNLSYGKLKKKNIGYIYLGSMGGQKPSVIDKIINELEQYNAIILDVRQNTGGDDRYSARIAKAFSDGEHLIYSVETRNGVNHGDFDNKNFYYSSFNPSISYNKPVIVLTDRKTISAGEVFLLYMKSFAHVTQIGDTTAGDFSTVSNMRFLPNGWTYLYSIQKFLLPNGESLDGIGHIPEVYVRNSQADINSKKDKVLEEAVEYLFDQYQIE